MIYAVAASKEVCAASNGTNTFATGLLERIRTVIGAELVARRDSSGFQFELSESSVLE